MITVPNKMLKIYPCKLYTVAAGSYNSGTREFGSGAKELWNFNSVTTASSLRLRQVDKNSDFYFSINLESAFSTPPNSELDELRVAAYGSSVKQVPLPDTEMMLPSWPTLEFIKQNGQQSFLNAPGTLKVRLLRDGHYALVRKSLDYPYPEYPLTVNDISSIFGEGENVIVGHGTFFSPSVSQ